MRNDSETRSPAHGARTRRPCRTQSVMVMDCLDMRLAADHKARSIWQLVEHKLDLDAFYAQIKVDAHTPGRTATDPAVLMTLWILAYSDGEKRARAIADLCEEHIAYQWVCGGAPVNHHTLSDFQKNNGPKIDAVFADVISLLIESGLLKAEEVSIDGTRCRACAGSGSFRSEERLKILQEEAQKRLAEIKNQPVLADVSKRESAARLRAAREREDRVRQALEAVEAIKAKRAENPNKRDETRTVRCSTTDPESRRMRMPNTGSNPGYNIQIATDNATKIPVASKVEQSSSDQSFAQPMVKEVKMTTGKNPKKVMCDIGYAKRDAVENLAKENVEVFFPSDQNWVKPDPQPNDGPGMTALKERMKTEEGQKAYRMRSATAELTNAAASQMGMKQFNVRGLARVGTVVKMTMLAVVWMRVQAQWPEWLWS